MNVFRAVICYVVQWKEAKHVLSQRDNINGMLDTFITKDRPHGIRSCDVASVSHGRTPCGYLLRSTIEWSKTYIKSKSKGQWDAQYFHNQRPYSGHCLQRKTLIMPLPWGIGSGRPDGMHMLPGHGICASMRKVRGISKVQPGSGTTARSKSFHGWLLKVLPSIAHDVILLGTS